MNSGIFEIIIKVLNGDASPSDKDKLFSWIDQDQCNLAHFKQTEAIWNSLEIINTSQKYDSEQAFEIFKNKVIDKSGKNRKKFLFKKLDFLLRIAAAIIILLGISYFLIRPEEKTVSIDDSTFEIISPQGSKSQVILPDGSKVWLNSKSRIFYNTNYNQAERIVNLEGEGYFEVKKNESKPFIVATSYLRIKALGTIFNVKSYPGENTIETTLIEGEVEVESDATGNSKKIIALKPNQKVTIYKESSYITDAKPEINKKLRDTLSYNIKPLSVKIISNEVVDPTVMTAWKNNIIYFDNEQFQDLAVRLERRFGVRFHFVNEELKKLRFTGKFSDLIIEQVLDALQFASPFYYKYNGEDIYISKNPIEKINTSS